MNRYDAPVGEPYRQLLKMVEGILSNPDSRQARLDELKNMWKK
jgi:hypothetical protein